MAARAAARAHLHGDHPVGAVGRQHGDLVARLEAHALERGRDLGDAAGDLAKRLVDVGLRDALDDGAVAQAPGVGPGSRRGAVGCMRGSGWCEALRLCLGWGRRPRGLDRACMLASRQLAWQRARVAGRRLHAAPAGPANIICMAPFDYATVARGRMQRLNSCAHGAAASAAAAQLRRSARMRGAGRPAPARARAAART